MIKCSIRYRLRFFNKRHLDFALHCAQICCHVWNGDIFAVKPLLESGKSCNRHTFGVESNSCAHDIFFKCGIDAVIKQGHLNVALKLACFLLQLSRFKIACIGNKQSFFTVDNNNSVSCKKAGQPELICFIEKYGGVRHTPYLFKHLTSVCHFLFLLYHSAKI